MKITCDRRLGDEEMEMLVAEAKNMDDLRNKLEINKQWVGDGMLYGTKGKEGEQCVDQKEEEEEE